MCFSENAPRRQVSLCADETPVFMRDSWTRTQRRQSKQCCMWQNDQTKLSLNAVVNAYITINILI